MARVRASAGSLLWCAVASLVIVLPTGVFGGAIVGYPAAAEAAPHLREKRHDDAAGPAEPALFHRRVVVKNDRLAQQTHIEDSYTLPDGGGNTAQILVHHGKPKASRSGRSKKIETAKSPAASTRLCLKGSVKSGGKCVKRRQQRSRPVRGSQARRSQEPKGRNKSQSRF